MKGNKLINVALVMAIVLIPLFLFSERNHSYSFSSAMNPEKRIKRYMDEALQVAGYFKPYRKYIGSHGLFSENTYEYLEKQLEKDKKFVRYIETRSTYLSVGEFMVDFREYSLAFICYSMERDLKGKSVDEYFKRLNDIQKSYEMIIQTNNLKPVQKKQIETKINQLDLLKERFTDYEKALNKVPKSVMLQIEKYEDEFMHVYEKLLVG